MADQTTRNVPRIRFKAYSEPWAEEKIGDVLAEKRRPIVLEDDQRYELITVKRRNEGVVSRGHLLGREILVKNYAELKAGDFVISKRQVVHGATGIVPPALDGAIVSNEYLTAVDSEKLLSEFLTILASLPAMRRKFFLSSYGVDIEKLFFDADDWKKRTVMLPDIQEQNRIAQVFRNIDQLSSLHRCRYEKLLALRVAMIEKTFPQPGTNVPEVRFGGFTGAWSTEEMRRLGTFAKGSGFSKGELKASGTPIVLYGRLYTDYQTAITQVDTFVDDRKGAIKSKGNEVIVPASGETSEDIARASALLQGGVIIGGDLNIINPCDRLDPYFLALALSSGQPKCDLARRAQGKTVVHVRAADISSVSICFPELHEQMRISAFFRSVDELILLHSHQIKKVQQLKWACEKSMFA
ncbi:MAG: restriction endonuclease subunit S [Burkholderiales bacterium]|nr:restriction endonuclease subunit S [Burkholderiales bacterium]